MGREWDRKKKLEDLLANKDLAAEQRLSYEAQLERMKGLLKIKAARYKINKLKKVVESSKKSLSAVEVVTPTLDGEMKDSEPRYGRNIILIVVKVVIMAFLYNVLFCCLVW
jgi:hypothetical protein